MKRYLSPTLLLCAAIIWGFAFPFQKAAATVPPITLTAARSLVAVLFLFPMIGVLDRVRHTGRTLLKNRRPDFTRQEWIGGILSGTILSVATVIQQLGLAEGADAGKTAFITALYVVIVPLIGLPLGKRVSAQIWVSIGIAVVGFWLLCITGDLSIQPSDLIVLGCAVIFSFHILSIDHFSPLTDGVRMSAIQFLTAFILTALAALIFEGAPNFSALGEHIFPILYLGIASSGIAYTLQILGQVGTSHAVCSVLLSLESVFGVIGSAIILGERMTPREYLGCAVVFIAVLLAQIDISVIKNRKKPQNH